MNFALIILLAIIIIPMVKDEKEEKKRKEETLKRFQEKKNNTDETKDVKIIFPGDPEYNEYKKKRISTHYCKSPHPKAGRCPYCGGDLKSLKGKYGPYLKCQSCNYKYWKNYK